MEPNDQVFIWFFAFSVATTAALSLGIAWHRAQKRIQQLEQHLLDRQVSGGGTDATDILAQRVEALAASVEHLAEGQDFLSRMIATNRSAVPAIPERPQIVTPH